MQKILASSCLYWILWNSSFIMLLIKKIIPSPFNVTFHFIVKKYWQVFLSKWACPRTKHWPLWWPVRKIRSRRQEGKLWPSYKLRWCIQYYNPSTIALNLHLMVRLSTLNVTNLDYFFYFYEKCRLLPCGSVYPIQVKL